jgi:uracil-DNA glycosylase
MTEVDIDINIIRDSLNSTLVESGWDKMLSIYINGLNFDYIVNSLADGVKKGRRFTPKFKDTFNAFIECPYDDLKVVIVGQDPYPQLGVADGIAFSCSKKDKAEKSLEYINKAIGSDYTDLRCWSKQGVLLINTALTVEINKIGSHYGLWKSFTEYLFDTINKNHNNIPVILMGKKAEVWQPLLSNQKIYKTSHPASAAYRGGEWDHNDVFNKVNKELKKQGRVCINW